jgi:HPt (histidine-containing phosphotransfer) domain-containing protein
MSKPKPGMMIPPDAYPQMVARGEAAAISRMLKSPETVVRGSRVIGASMQGLRGAVRDYVTELEQAGDDLDRISEKAHEIKGFAETAGLTATGRIAEGLCRYFDESEQLGVGPDMGVVRLHIGAIARAARAEDEVSQMSDVVAKELAALVNHKLMEIKALLA